MKEWRMSGRCCIEDLNAFNVYLHEQRTHPQMQLVILVATTRSVSERKRVSGKEIENQIKRTTRAQTYVRQTWSIFQFSNGFATKKTFCYNISSESFSILNERGRETEKHLFYKTNTFFFLVLFPFFFTSKIIFCRDKFHILFIIMQNIVLISPFFVCNFSFNKFAMRVVLLQLAFYFFWFFFFYSSVYAVADPPAPHSVPCVCAFGFCFISCCVLCRCCSRFIMHRTGK